ncbi:hypothetical protein BLNAU_18331 [Blattamonas nauphoetae]|uniref:Uncharacterized protein n=1 Tax=Blattamonas nauphoetae TaxID=2049346 RepID=A0ABQ9X973_9EUKA|nr:hypothetical protein BLNAU_18331 [Blattamonas nauphoetae]
MVMFIFAIIDHPEHVHFSLREKRNMMIDALLRGVLMLILSRKMVDGNLQPRNWMPKRRKDGDSSEPSADPYFNLLTQRTSECPPAHLHAAGRLSNTKTTIHISTLLTFLVSSSTKYKIVDVRKSTSESASNELVFEGETEPDWTWWHHTPDSRAGSMVGLSFTTPAGPTLTSIEAELNPSNMKEVIVFRTNIDLDWSILVLFFVVTNIITHSGGLSVMDVVVCEDIYCEDTLLVDSDCVSHHSIHHLPNAPPTVTLFSIQLQSNPGQFILVVEGMELPHNDRSIRDHAIQNGWSELQQDIHCVECVVGERDDHESAEQPVLHSTITHTSFCPSIAGRVEGESDFGSDRKDTASQSVLDDYQPRRQQSISRPRIQLLTYRLVNMTASDINVLFLSPLSFTIPAIPTLVSVEVGYERDLIVPLTLTGEGMPDGTYEVRVMKNGSTLKVVFTIDIVLNEGELEISQIDSFFVRESEYFISSINALHGDTVRIPNPLTFVIPPVMLDMTMDRVEIVALILAPVLSPPDDKLSTDVLSLSPLCPAHLMPVDGCVFCAGRGE